MSILRRMTNLFHRSKLDQEIDAELRAHIEMRTADNLASGMSPEQARRDALLRFGNRTVLKERVIAADAHMFLDSLWQDIHYGLRMLRKSPGFTAVAVLTLALGIGANTAIFSVIEAVLLRAFPYRAPQQLVLVFNSNPAWGQDRIPLCVADFDDWKAMNHAFVQPAAFHTNLYDYTSSREPQQITGAGVSPGFFSTLGVEPMLGRGFLPEEEAPGSALAVIVSEHFWIQNLGGDPHAVGKSITLDGKSYSVVGVMPGSFRFPSEGVQLWEPLRLAPPTRRGPYFLRGLARLRPGVTLQQARENMTAVSQRIREETHSPDDGASIDSIANFGFNVVPFRTYLVGDVQPALLVLMAGAGFLLLIAVANLAHLMLAKTLGRQSEFAVRRALGASRLRLIRQLLAEALLLACLGSSFGLLLGYASLNLLLTLSPFDLPRLDRVGIDGGVLGFTLLVAILCCALFALAPAWGILQSNPNAALKEGGGRSPLLRHKRLRGILVVAEVGLTLILTVGATLMARSLIRLQGVNAGFQPNNVLTAEIQMSDARYSDSQHVRSFYQELLTRLDSLPGVESAALSSGLPPDQMQLQDTFTIQEHPTPAGESDPLADFLFVNGDYFRTLRVPLIEGRTFMDADSQSAPLVVIINQTLAKAFFPNEDPVGKLLRQNRSNPWMQIVGVVGDVKYEGLDASVIPTLYTPYTQHGWPGAYLAVRAKGNIAGLAAAIRDSVWSLDNQLPITDMVFAPQRMHAALAAPRFRAILLAAFGVVALALSVIGIYGVISYSTAQRTREIGVRTALGAQPRDIVRMVLGEGLLLALIGIAIGVASALVLTRFLRSMLFEIKPTDPATFLGVAILLVIAALLACYIPARRAMRVDPIVALRYE
jgi:putative ABC transport system permease protein